MKDCRKGVANHSDLDPCDGVANQSTVRSAARGTCRLGIPTSCMESAKFREWRQAGRKATLRRALSMRFPRHGGSYPDRVSFPSKTEPSGGTESPPVRRPRAQVAERVGRPTVLLIVRR